MLMGVCGLQIDFKAAQLLNSRLFHDLAGATSAIGAGIEFIGEPGSEESAIALLTQSADRLRRRLDFFRGAFGLGGGKHGGLSVAEAGTLVSGWFADSKSKLIWPSEETLMQIGNIEASKLKILMILSMSAEECLPRGGEVLVQMTLLAEGLGLAVSALGPGATPPEGTIQALDFRYETDKLTARNVVIYVAAQLAKAHGARVEADASRDKVDYASLIPSS